MNTKIISDKALSVIDQYAHFRVANAICSIPYYNNRKIGVRGGLRALIGKGSPKDIFDEVEILSLKQKVDLKTLDGESLKKFMVDNDIGIDCSGFAYYILNAECLARGLGTLDKHLSFPFTKKGWFGKIRARLHPENNTDVATFSHDKNSHVISIDNIEPGDIITMNKLPDAPEEDRARNHILIIHQVEYQNFVPTTIHYSHSVAWPTDGVYGHGIHQGVIEIIDPHSKAANPLFEQRWLEAGALERARASLTEVRRLNWFR